MTISTTTRTVTHSGNGVAVNFAYPFKIADQVDLLVYVKSGSVFVLKSLGTDYTVSGVGSQSGGTVSFTAAPAVGTGNVRFLRRTALTQLVDYVTNDDFPAEIHEAALDKLTMAVQDYLGDSMTVDPTANFWDAESKVIKNVADPVDAQDAATLAYGEANWGGAASDSAAASATAAAASEAAAAAIFDAFDDRYLGAKTSAPTLDNDGNALQDGALYYDTTRKKLSVYDLGTTTWISLPVTLLSSLTDVTLTSLATGEVLQWDGSKWVNSKIGSGAFALTADISPAQITANQNDYNPTGLSTASTLRLSTDASRDVTGLQGGADGRLMIVHNVGANALVLKNESASSTAANRFYLGGTDVTLAANQSVTLQYDATSSRWRLVSVVVESGANPDLSNLSATGLAKVAKAWVNFDATRNASGGSDTNNTNRYIRASFNVASVLKNANGDFTITFSSALADANFSVCGNAAGISGSYSIILPNTATPTQVTYSAPSASACRICVVSAAANAGVNSQSNDVHVFR